jgi:GH18 family chitinase
VTDTRAIVSQIPFHKITHINYAFLLPNADGTLLPISNPWKLSDLVEAAHEQGVKVLISVGGWGYDPQFEALAADPTTRARLVSELTSFVDEYNLDGADIDWEYPDPDPSENNSAYNFANLMRELSTEMHNRDKLLTAAVVALGPNGDSILPETFNYVDFLNIMVYDGAGEQHASFSYAQEALDYWHNRGLPGAQTVLGVPFYSRPHETPYRKLVEVDANAPYTDTIDYYGSMVNYNGLSTMKQKTELAMKRASGIMIWTLADDTNDNTSLLKAIHETVYGK